MLGKILLIVSTLILGVHYSVLTKITEKLPSVWSYMLLMALFTGINTLALLLFMSIKSPQPIVSYLQELTSSKTLLTLICTSGVCYMLYMIIVSYGFFETKSGLLLSLFELSIPSLVIICSFLLFGELKYNSWTIIGGLLLLGGSLILTLKG